MPQVKVIQLLSEPSKKLRVAAYARVSSDSADQLNSFATQVDYYTGYIQSKDEWEFAGLYADEAISGITADKRSDFQRLLVDCHAGKIDRILVKSISRFARNTLDCIQTVRELKQLNIPVEFEKENIDTGSMGSEMLLSVLGAAAQEESLSISKNLKWNYRHRMKNGDFTTHIAPFGYSYKSKTLVPNPNEVPIIEFIFNSYLSGKSLSEIAKELTQNEKPITSEKHSEWNRTSIQYILTNEKYVGDSLVQKRFTPDELPLKKIRNVGQLPRYYIRNSHPAIISREIFEAVQVLLQQKTISKSTVSSYPLSQIVKCGACGSTFHRRIQKGIVRWSCYKHLQDKDLCPMGIVQEYEIYQGFLKVHNKLLDNRDSILKVMLNQLLELQTKVTFARPDIVALNEKIADLVKQNHSLARLQAKGYIDSVIFIERSNGNNQRIERMRRELRQLQGPDELSSLIDSTTLLMDLLDKASPLLEFEPSIFKIMVKEIVVYPEKFRFYLNNNLALDEGRCLR